VSGQLGLGLSESPLDHRSESRRPGGAGEIAASVGRVCAGLGLAQLTAKRRDFCLELTPARRPRTLCPSAELQVVLSLLVDLTSAPAFGLCDVLSLGSLLSFAFRHHFRYTLPRRSCAFSGDLCSAKLLRRRLGWRRRCRGLLRRLSMAEHHPPLRAIIRRKRS